MLHKLLTAFDRQHPLPTVSAHCDIPCKIYDPISAQLSVLTMIRLCDLIDELATKPALTIQDQAQLARLVAQKEQHGIELKQQVTVIWGDYFKQPQFDQVAGVHDLVHRIMLQASKTKQHVVRAHALELLELVNQFAEAFWLTKGVKTFRAQCPYPTEQIVAYPALSPQS
ncbi:superoxide dismutase, Ni [Photobacterium aphoticum]|uniref:Superoxide dismutase n=1 Tax=Photobacterium aphoticum TaxID=754436 RepID=A0A0J1GKY0_9GAMM|nr:superoxide dismutase, Ni [Photobacterium aphoticum]KLV00415.1 superoxide dismutase [Photobacterium aphoticum]PSU59756.1 superoxide dismutase, Ni [Photobacterium aphoticum]GHA42578.1 superoxide dismutase [Ni] [Photobacterium aphoticum]